VVAEALREAPRGGGDLGTAPVDLGFPSFQLPGAAPGEHHRTDFRWLMASDVCKHCTHAGCLDVCPTGALFRTEFGTVVVQEDICNGCGYCVPACPFGVIDKRPHDGRAFKCTFCYDRQKDGMTPACAKACPTESIKFGPVSELHQIARRRVEDRRAQDQRAEDQRRQRHRLGRRRVEEHQGLISTRIRPAISPQRDFPLYARKRGRLPQPPRLRASGRVRRTRCLATG